MSSSKCSFTCICGIFLPLNPSTTTGYARSALYPSLRFTLSLQSAFYTQSAFYPGPQSAFYTDRFFKVYEYGYSTTIVHKSWSFYSSRESMDELIVNSEEQKVQDCLLSTNFYLNISTASVMNEKVYQINQWHDTLCYKFAL